MAKRILKNTSSILIVKISGTDVTETISLATDFLHPSTAPNGSPIRVNVSYVQWNVSSGSTDTIVVRRNTFPILNLYQNAGELDMSGNGGFQDDTENSSDLVCSIIGTGNLFLTLRKVSGFDSKLETAQYGSYDNPNVVGS